MPAPRIVLGGRGEQAAVEWYEAGGYQILDRNWRCREGEIDLVAARGPLVVFCEVKTRRGSGYGAPMEAVTFAKQRRLRRLAAQWLADRRRAGGAGFPDIRFDVASVMPGPTGLVVEVIEAAF